MKDKLLNFSGIALPLGSIVYNFIEKATPILGFIALCVSVGVGISAIIVNIKKVKASDRQKKIDDLIFKK
jgi:hypothetical protein